MASGTGSQIAFIRTGSLAMDVASVIVGSVGGGWRWTNFVSESIEHNIEELEEQAITGNHDAPPSHEGATSGAGDISIEPNPNALGAFMRAAIGVNSSTQVVDAGSTGTNSGAFAGAPGFTHYFKPRETAHDERSFNEPHAAMVYKDTGSAWFFNGALVGALNFNTTAGQLATTRISLMAREVTTRARTSLISSLVSSGGKPWIWDSVSIELGANSGSLAAVTEFEALELDLVIPHEGVLTHDGTKLWHKIVKSDFRRLNATGTLCFQNQNEYHQFQAYQNRHLRVTARQSANSTQLIGNPSSAFYPTLQIDVPLFKFTSFSVPIGGPNRLTASFNGKGERSDTFGLTVEYRLTNVVSGY